MQLNGTSSYSSTTSVVPAYMSNPGTRLGQTPTTGRSTLRDYVPQASVQQPAITAAPPAVTMASTSAAESSTALAYPRLSPTPTTAAARPVQEIFGSYVPYIPPAENTGFTPAAVPVQLGNGAAAPELAQQEVTDVLPTARYLANHSGGHSGTRRLEGTSRPPAEDGNTAACDQHAVHRRAAADRELRTAVSGAGRARSNLAASPSCRFGRHLDHRVEQQLRRPFGAPQLPERLGSLELPALPRTRACRSRGNAAQRCGPRPEEHPSDCAAPTIRTRPSSPKAPRSARRPSSSSQPSRQATAAGSAAPAPRAIAAARSALIASSISRRPWKPRPSWARRSAPPSSPNPSSSTPASSTTPACRTCRPAPRCPSSAPCAAMSRSRRRSSSRAASAASCS